jgi:hypothetical protein
MEYTKMTKTTTKSGGPNYKGLYQELQKTLPRERDRTANLIKSNLDMSRELAEQDDMIQELKTLDCRQCLNLEDVVKERDTLFKYCVSLAAICILCMVWVITLI